MYRIYDTSEGMSSLSGLKHNLHFDHDELIRFSQEHPWRPHYPVALVKRFLGELISSRDMVIDFFDDHGRAATGVLIDTVANPANDACLEIIGIRSDVNVDAVLIEMVARCKALTPERRSGFQMGAETKAQQTLLQTVGLKHYYDVYEMECLDLSKANPSSEFKIESGRPADANEVYSVLCEAFKYNPDTSIPDAQTWRASFLKNPKARYLLWREAGKLKGFLHLIPHSEGTAEINTIGVLSECRGRGLGRALLDHGLKLAHTLGYKKTHLTVATANQKALDLYLRAGFQVLSSQSCFRWSRS